MPQSKNAKWLHSGLGTPRGTQIQQGTGQEAASLTPHALPAHVDATKSFGDSLPQVWQDLLAAAHSAQSTEYLDKLACRLPPAPLASTAPSPSPHDNQPRDASLDVAPDTIFARYLSPEALVCNHRLGKPEVRRLYQALQVYSLGFHQAMLELTRHASGKAQLLPSLWRGFAMLWDAALQAVFPAETVQTSRERQAALLKIEQLELQVQEDQSKAASLAQGNAALLRQMEDMAVNMLSVKADAAAATQGSASLSNQLRAATAECASLAQQAEAGRQELLEMQMKMAALQGPQESLYSRSQQLERLVKDKQSQLSMAAKQAADALAAKDEAQQALLGERLRREAAERQIQQLQEDLEIVTSQLQAAAGQAASIKDRELKEAADRADDTARLHTARSEWEARALAAVAQADTLREQLESVQEQLEAERSKTEELVATLWPLTARVKAMEAASLHGGN